MDHICKLLRCWLLLVLMTLLNLVSARPVAVQADTYNCFCQPGTTPWGCPFMAPPFRIGDPNPDMNHDASGRCDASGLPSPPCGPVSGSCSRPLVGSGARINRDYTVEYNFKVNCPACCTAFGIHAGSIDAGVDQVVDNLVYCPGSLWGYYKFIGPSFAYHITETAYNEPCYVALRTTGHTHIHIHSNVDVQKPAICIGKPSGSLAITNNFLTNMQAALQRRGITYVEVGYSKDPSSACVDAPNTYGRDQLGLEITKGLAIKMGNQAYMCGGPAGSAPLASSEYGALWEALRDTFPQCVRAGGSGGDSTFPDAGCGVGCGNDPKCGA